MGTLESIDLFSKDDPILAGGVAFFTILNFGICIYEGIRIDNHNNEIIEEEAKLEKIVKIDFESSYSS